MEANLNRQTKGQKLLTSVEMEFFIRTAKYTLFDYKRNEEILEYSKAEPADARLRRYESNWLRQVTRMNSNRMPKVMLNYGKNGQTQVARRFEQNIRRGRNRSIKA